MAIDYKLGGEELHKIGENGAKRIKTWLDSTYRFRIDRSIYDLDANGMPYTQMRVPQLQKDRFERFDLVGSLLGEDAMPGRRIFVECKEYSEAGKQAALYDEYLAVCYSGFVALSSQIGGPADIEFMWATSHPFAVTTYSRLVGPDQIEVACKSHAERLGEYTFDRSTAEQLAPRLWLAIINERIEEMIMGVELRKAVAARIVELAL